MNMKTVTFPIQNSTQFPFIQEESFLYEFFLSVYNSPGGLQRVLQQDWVPDWEGWSDADTELSTASCLKQKQKTAAEIVVQFARISMTNVHARYLTDKTRRQQLENVNLHVGKGEAYGASNACLADSLLQLLLFEEVINCPVYENFDSVKE